MKLFERAISIPYKVFTALKIVLLEHVPLFFLFMLYLIYGFYIEYRLENFQIIKLGFDIAKIMPNLLLFNFVFFIIAHYMIRVLEGNIQGIYAKWYDIIATYFCFNRLAGFIIIYYLVQIELSLFDSLKMSISYLVPFCYDTIFTKWDYILHLNNHPWTLLSPLLTNTITVRIIDLLYISWFFVINVFIFWLALSNRRKLRMQFFMTLLLIFFLIGNLLATVLSSAGPCYYENIVGFTENNPYKPLMEKLHSIEDDNIPVDKPYDKFDNSPLIALELEDKLWDNYINKIRSFGHYISAMPSVHVAFAALLALTVSSVNIYLGIIFWVYWAVIQIGSVILGWHYAIDGYFSTILTIGLWKISAFLNNWFCKKLPKEVQSQILGQNVSILSN